MSFDPRGCWVKKMMNGKEIMKALPALDIFGGRRCGSDKVKAIEDLFVSHT
jgi:hypothetical protein